jgi:hypothetical protein
VPFPFDQSRPDARRLCSIAKLWAAIGRCIAAPDNGPKTFTLTPDRAGQAPTSRLTMNNLLGNHS